MFPEYLECRSRVADEYGCHSTLDVIVTPPITNGVIRSIHFQAYFENSTDDDIF